MGNVRSGNQPDASYEAHETEKDFVVKLHNEGKGKDEIAQQYAQQCCGRQSPSDADKRFVDEALTNLEG